MNETQATLERINHLKAFEGKKTGVKGVVDAGIKSVPSIFVRPQEERSKDLGTCADNINVGIIDFGESEHQIIQEILLAAKTWGFFQVVNHGVPIDLLDKMIERAKMFHQQDEEVKKQFYNGAFFSKMIGFHSNHDLYKSKAANWRDSFYVSTMATGDVDFDQLPPISQDVKHVIKQYANHILEFGDRILTYLSMGLGLEPDYLKKLEITQGWSLVCQYYPACPEPLLTLGINAHTDISFLTILLQDQIGGLQVLYENQWVNVQPVSGALIVNIGDALKMISNDLLKSAYHRVISKNVGPRISVGLFFNGLYKSKRMYGPIKELTSEENPPIYREFTIEDILTFFTNKSLDELGTDFFKVKHPYYAS